MRNMHLFIIIYLIPSVSIFGKTSRFDNKARQNQYIASDYLHEDDHEDFELSEIIALSTSSVDLPIDITTPEERKEHVDVHNAYRRNYTKPFIEVSDMIMLEYNNTLEWTAAEFVKECTFDHFFPEIDNMTDWQGQCLYTGPSRMNSRSLYVYYMEYIDWFFENQTCRQPFPEFQCGHLLQVILSETEHVGFARKSNCWPRRTTVLQTTHYIVGGVGYDPEDFRNKFGIACSNCPAGFYCAMDLCIPYHQRFCKAYNLDCECKRACQNCGTPDLENCKCICKLGWDWDDCSFPCQDRVEKLSKQITCNRRRCIGKTGIDTTRFRYIRLTYCRQHCKICSPLKKPLIKNKPENLCCEGKICDDFYKLDTDTCNCTLICPSEICKYGTTTESATTATTTAAVTTTTTKPVTTRATTLTTTTATSKAATTPMTTTVLPPTTTSTTLATTTAATTVITTKTDKKIPKTTTSIATITNTAVTTAITTKNTSTTSSIGTILTTVIGPNITTSESSQKTTVEREPRPISIAYLFIPTIKQVLWISFTTLVIL